ncbi:hypothetical protein EDB87DRAFT_1649897 [Lactarius vividus]|nr:hypothetical protein EDB87DRAFT_1649897 [Lactarius vividus]
MSLHLRILASEIMPFAALLHLFAFVHAHPHLLAFTHTLLHMHFRILSLCSRALKFAALKFPMLCVHSTSPLTPECFPPHFTIPPFSPVPQLTFPTI